MPTPDPCRLDPAVRPGAGDPTTHGARHIPVRTCVGCRHKAEQPALLRVVAVQDEPATDRWLILPDERRRGQGRGAYLHLDPQCLQNATARRAFGRALRLPAKAQVDAGAVQERLRQQ